MIPQSFIEDLLSRVDVVDVVESYIALKRSGSNFSARCPFHNEKTPSFTVSQSKQFYHCFGCGAHGTAISFLMEYQGMGFIDAVSELAVRVGMTVPEIAAPKDKPPGSDEDLVGVVAQAAHFYKQCLKDSERAVAYLKGRGLSGEIAARYGLGYARDDWQGLEAEFGEYAKSNALVTTGLVVEGNEGRRYDRFRDRVMFPIQNQRGNIIGFGGRVIDAGEPKYMNSPETPLFEKGRELYGLVQARAGIRQSGTIVVVEGYMDVVALAQSGVDYAVATLGTATTPWQVQKLLKQCDRVIFCFDGDAAGRRAAWRALENSLPQLVDGKQIGFLFLPEGDDPDSFVRQHGKEAFEALLTKAQPLSEFMFHELATRASHIAHPAHVRRQCHIRHCDRRRDRGRGPRRGRHADGTRRRGDHHGHDQRDRGIHGDGSHAQHVQEEVNRHECRHSGRTDLLTVGDPVRRWPQAASITRYRARR